MSDRKIWQIRQFISKYTKAGMLQKKFMISDDTEELVLLSKREIDNINANDEYIKVRESVADKFNIKVGILNYKESAGILLNHKECMPGYKVKYVGRR